LFQAEVNDLYATYEGKGTSSGEALKNPDEARDVVMEVLKATFPEEGWDGGRSV